MINYHLLLGRKHGASEGYPVLISFGDALALSRRYEELTGPQCAEFAKEHAELLFVSDGAVLANHDFPDPKQVEAQRVAKALGEARRVMGDLDAAHAAADAAKALAAEKLAAVKQLTPEQRRLLAEEDKAKAEAETRAKAEKDRADAEAKAEKDKADAEAKAAQDKADAAVAKDTFKAELGGQTDEQLLALVATNKLDVPAGADRAAVLEALAVAAGFPTAEQFASGQPPAPGQ